MSTLELIGLFKRRLHDVVAELGRDDLGETNLAGLQFAEKWRFTLDNWDADEHVEEERQSLEDAQHLLVLTVPGSLMDLIVQLEAVLE